MIKKYILGLFIAILVPTTLVFASNPILTLNGSGDGSNVVVNLTGADANSSVALLFNEVASGGLYLQQIGTTNINGAFSGSVNTNTLDINTSTPVRLVINGYQTNTQMWPYNRNSSGSQIIFSQNNPVVNVGQSSYVTVTGGNGTYYISSNSSNGVVNASISGSTLSFSGVAYGSSMIRVCSATESTCSTITISTNSNNNGPLTLNPSAVTLNIGQSGTVQITGGVSPYSVYTVSGNSISTFVSGNTVTLSGITGGMSSLNVCSSNGTCSILNVTIAGGTTNSNSMIGFLFPLAVNESETITLTGGNGSSYYLQSGVSSPVTASISGNTLSVRGITYGTSIATVCQSGNGTCLPITFIVNQAAGTGGPFIFDNDLYIGLTSSDVGELQRILIDGNYLSSGVTGYYGDLTFAAVQRYQSVNGISSTGYFGPLTRALMNR